MRAVTLPMARALRGPVGIPADVLLREADADLGNHLTDIEQSWFPVRSIGQLAELRNGPTRQDAPSMSITILSCTWNRT